MKKLHFALLICSVFLTACSKDLSLTEDSLTTNASLTINTSNYSIPLEDALKSLQAYLDSEKDLMTKSGSQEVKSRIISDVRTIRLNTVNTKSTDLPVDCDSLLYLVNFQDDEGFAILAADTRISADVIAVTDNGSMSEEDLYSAISDCSRKIYSEYPTSGPGIFTSEDYPGEYFLNPNTFDFYDPSVDDYYVGNFTDDVSDTSSYLESSTIPKFIGNLVVAYSLNEITSAPTISSSNWDKDDSLQDIIVEDFITTTNTTYTTKVEPILTFAEAWTQESPFNDYCPTVSKWFSSESRTAYAGCVPLAIAKICTHHEKPSITYNNVNVDWAALKANYKSASSSAAAATRYIGKKCTSLYFYEGTFTFPSRAKSFMKKNSYSNVKLQDYNTSIVTSMLDNNNPLFICSVPQYGFLNYDLANSHGWNIDGYKIKTVTKTTEYYLNFVLQETTTTTTNTTMVHCDFGWGGYCNGYFVSGVFNLGSSSAEFDYKYDAGQESTYYNSYLKIISYE